MRGPVKVVYVLGFGRSGSTILDLVLGRLDGFFSAGELQSLWRESLLDGRLCGCGDEVQYCSLWTKVLGDGCSELGVTPDEVAALQADRLRLPDLGPRSWIPHRRGDDWRTYAAILDRLYQRIAEVTGARVIVDSSKLPTVAAALHRSSAVDLYYVHLVRDARAVAYSWMRTKAAVDRVRPGEMERFGAARSAATWVVRQLAAERVRARAPDRSTLVRYEDFVTDVQGTAARVADLAGEPGAAAGLAGDGSVLVATNHTVSGNPVRLQRGPIGLQEDAEWKTCLPGRARATVDAIAWPLLKRYGYL